MSGITSPWFSQMDEDVANYEQQQLLDQAWRGARSKKEQDALAQAAAQEQAAQEQLMLSNSKIAQSQQQGAAPIGLTGQQAQNGIGDAPVGSWLQDTINGQIAAGNNPGAMQMSKASGILPDAQYKTLMDRLNGAQLNSQKLQEEGISDLQGRIKKLSETPETQDSLQRAVIMAADMWGGGGGKFNQLYSEANPQLTKAQRQAAITQLEDTLRKSRGDLSDSQIAMLKAQLGYQMDKAKLTAKGNEPADIKEWQYKAAEFASRAGGGDEAMDQLFASGYTPNTAGGWIPFESWKPEDRKAYENYSQTFINSVLRRESGASISDPEAQRALAQYVPVPGDSPERIREKSLLRKQAVSNMGITAGPAMKMMQGINTRGVQSGAPQGAAAGGTPWKKFGG